MVKKILCNVILTSLLGVTIMSCQKPSAPPAPQAAKSAEAKSTPSIPAAKEKERTVGVSLLTRQHVFYNDLEQSLKQTAEANGIKLIITSAEWDLSRQLNQVEDFITQKVDAIVVCPCDTDGISAAIQAANNANIPIFTADIAAKGGKVVSHIASDNVAGGRKGGEYMAKLLNGKGKVAIIDHPQAQSVLDRVRGFEEAIAQYPDIQIVAKPDGGAVRDKAMKAAEDLLQAFPDLDGIFAINDDTALGTLSAMEAAGRTRTSIVGYDAVPEARAAIARGSVLKADVIQSPKNIGATTIETIVKYLKGESVPATIPVEVGIVDKDTVEQPTA